MEDEQPARLAHSGRFFVLVLVMWQVLLGLNYLSYGYGARVNKLRAQYSKQALERQLVKFDTKIRDAEDYKDLSSVYFGEVALLMPTKSLALSLEMEF